MPLRDLRGDLRRRLGAASAVLGCLLLVRAAGTVTESRAAFSSSTSTGTSRLRPGSLRLTDDDAGAVMFAAGDLVADTTAERCINVDYEGSSTADVRLSATTSGELAEFLAIRVEVGHGAMGGPNFDCTGFVRDRVLFDGPLAAFGVEHGSFSNGLQGFEPARSGERRTYRLASTLADDNSAQGRSASATWWWEARPA
ncbi:MAG: hypothetical protein U0Q22_14055 [Acidimicrobiales bacterium]